MKNAKSWCTKSYLRKVKSTEITIKRKSVSKPRIVEETKDVKIDQHLVIGTPVRKLRIVTPNTVSMIRDAPSQKKYKSMRRIEF